MPETVALAYGLTDLGFGPDYIIPKPFDPRLVVEMPIAVAKAAMASGVATRPIADLKAYRERLTQFVFRSGLTMKPIFERARRRAAARGFADGEEERVLRAVQVLLEEGLARADPDRPPRRGRGRAPSASICALPLGQGVELCDPESDPRYDDYVAHYLAQMGRSGVTPEAAREIVRTRPTVIGAIMVDRGEADALIAGPTGRFEAPSAAARGAGGAAPRRPRGLDPASSDPRARPAVHGRHLRQHRPDRRGGRRDHAARRRDRAALRHHAQGRRCCRTPISAASTPTARARCATRWR